MDKQKFLEWYFGGSDQEQQATLISLGREVMEALLEQGHYEICVNDLVLTAWWQYEEDKKQNQST